MVSVAQELGLPVKTLEYWRAQHRRLHGPGAGVPGTPPTLEAALAQLKELRRRLDGVEKDREILKKALAICSSDIHAK